MSREPLLLAGENLYTYTFNDPVNWRDPLGLWTGYAVYSAWERADWGRPTEWITPPYWSVPLPYKPAIRYKTIPISETTFEKQYQKGHKLFVLPVIPFPSRWFPLFQFQP